MFSGLELDLLLSLDVTVSVKNRTVGNSILNSLRQLVQQPWWALSDRHCLLTAFFCELGIDFSFRPLPVAADAISALLSRFSLLSWLASNVFLLGVLTAVCKAVQVSYVAFSSSGPTTNKGWTESNGDGVLVLALTGLATLQSSI